MSSSQQPTSNLPPGQALPPGARLEEFVIERVLGSGGFGITYLARDSRLGRRVVIKENLPVQFCWRNPNDLSVQPRHSSGEDADNFRYSLESFKREAATLASLDHPGIVKILRSFEAYGTAYFVMPFVDGAAFDEVIRRKREAGESFAEAGIVKLLDHVLSALDYLHERGIYHRDIKPGNILLTAAGEPVLIDFGAARQRLSERSLTVIESAGYTPFEQMQSRGKVGPWSDLYALGATLYKAITGETPAKATDRAFDDPLTPLAERVEWVGKYSPLLLKSIDRAMQPKAADRFQEAGEWRSAAQKQASGQSVRSPLAEAKKESRREAPVPDMAPVEKIKAQKTERRGMSKGDKPWLVGGVAVIVFILVKIAHLVSSNPPKLSQDSVGIPEERPAAALPVESAPPADPFAGVGRHALFTNSLGMKFVPVENTANGKQALFCIHETRNADYAAYAEQASGANDEWKQRAGPGKEQHPVVNVSWEDAVAFCEWLSRKEGRTYRLPTDHEWSLAAGIGGREDPHASPRDKSGKLDGVYPWGGGYPPSSRDGNYGRANGYARTAPVMRFHANSLGIYDLGGNAWEWCHDVYDPADPTGRMCVLRGASFYEASNTLNTLLSFYRSHNMLYEESNILLSSYRRSSTPGFRLSNCGFRCVVE